MAPPLLTLQDIHLTLGGGRPLLEGANLSVERGERLCVVGRNGSGKSTLLKIAAGMIEPDKGVRFLQPGTSIRYLAQEPDLSGFATTRAYAESDLGPLDDPYRALALLQGLGLTGEEDPATLSGGEARRAALARALAPEPDILLLDEPTNHLDLPAIEWLEAELKASRAALVLISHDRRFLTTLSRSTVWVDRGATRAFGRGFGEFEAWRDAQLEEEERQQHKLERQIVEEEHWLRYGVTARRKRNMKRLAGLQTLRKAHREHRRVDGNVALAASEGAVSGKLVIEAKGIAKAYGDRAIVKGFSTRVLRGDRLALVGANGAGKSTLVALLTGALSPDDGTIRLGANLEIATLDQKRASLDPTTTLRDALTGGGSEYVEVAGSRKHVMGYMRDFLFGPEQARTPIGRLSGGERGRLMLARALAQPSNLLVLDEPTNDLDLETLDLLQDMLADYPGTLLLVSHDRDFLDRVATSVVVAEGGGRWQDYAGGYTDMVAQRGAGIAGRVALPEPRLAAKVEVAEKPARALARDKLSFKEKHALETLPRRMASLEARKAELRGLLDDPAFYRRDPAGFTRQSEAFAALEVELATLEDEWLELELRREAVEG